MKQTHIRSAFIPTNSPQEIQTPKNHPGVSAIKSKQIKKRVGLLAGASVLSLLLVAGLVAAQTGMLQSLDQRSQAANVLGASARFSTSEVTVTSGEPTRTQIYIDPVQGTVPTAAKIFVTYDPNALDVVSVSAGSDFPVVLAPAQVDDQSGLISITVAREPGTTVLAMELSAVSIVYRARPESRLTALQIDPISEITAVGSRTSVLLGVQNLEISSGIIEAEQQILDNRDLTRRELREDNGKTIRAGDPKPTQRPEPSFEPIPPQL